VGQIMTDTFTQYAQEVKGGVFPGKEHSYGMSDDVLESIIKEFGDA
jgi:ketopantoate hydroxymethyltransferase